MTFSNILFFPRLPEGLVLDIGEVINLKLAVTVAARRLSPWRTGSDCVPLFPFLSDPMITLPALQLITALIHRSDLRWAMNSSQSATGK
jgi:hypothetical protein